MTTTIKAGIVQFDVKTGDLTSNLDAAFAGIRTLAAQGAALAVLPEMWSCGFDNRRLAAHAESLPTMLEKMSEAAMQYNMVIAGSMPEAADGRIYNSLHVIDADGSIAGIYRKIHLFSPTGEHMYFSAGNRPVVCSTSVGTLGLMICYDLRFPELCRALAFNEASIIVVSAQWPAERIAHWHILVQARAVENQVFVIAANRSGRDKLISYGGSSMMVSPFGKILAASEGSDPALLSGDIDLDDVARCRSSVHYLRDRMPGAYQVSDV